MPGVNLAMSAKFLMFRVSILAAVKALTLSATLLRLSSLRVAVTTISPTAVAAPGVDSMDAANATPVHSNGPTAAVITQALNKATFFVMSGMIPDRLSGWRRPSPAAGVASRLCDHICAARLAGAYRLVKLC